MKVKPFLTTTLFLSLSLTCFATKHVIFLHNKFLETHTLNDQHYLYGKVEFNKITMDLKNAGFNVIADRRLPNKTLQEYTNYVVAQIDSILDKRSSDTITVVGTSKGGYIAQMVSTQLNNPKLNFVFIGCFQESDIQYFPEINICGNILYIYEKSDKYGTSAVERKETSQLKISNFKEIELNTGLKHGFLFKAMDEWLNPTIKWANCKY
jgi:hypothetical protein